MKRFRAALFDWDVTLLNSQHINYLASAHIFEMFGLTPPTEEEYYREISSKYMPFYWDRGVPKTANKEDLNAIRRDFMTDNWLAAGLFPDVFPVLANFRMAGFKTAVISAEDSEILTKRIKLLGIGKLLHHCAGDASDKKILIWDTLDMFGMEPEECFFVDDSPGDIPAIKESGVYTIGITRGIRSREAIEAAHPDLVVDSLNEILHLVDAEE